MLGTHTIILSKNIHKDRLCVVRIFMNQTLLILDQVDFYQLEEKYPADAVFAMHPFMVKEI